MGRTWLALVTGVVLLTTVGIGILFSRQAGSPFVSAVDSEAEDCIGCGVDEDTSRFGNGRIPGERVSLPSNVASRPVVVVSVAEGCDYCAVPVATLALAVKQADSEKCTDYVPPSLILVGSKESDLIASQWLIDGFSSEVVHTTSTLKTEAWRTVLSTDLVPSILIADKDEVVVAQWIGFDPGHGADLIAAVQLAIGCTLAGTEPLVRSALAATEPGDRVPMWLLEAAGINEQLPAALIFSDDNYPLCVQIRAQTEELVSTLENQGITTVYVDATPSSDFLAERHRHLIDLTETHLGNEIITRLASMFETARDRNGIEASA